MKIIALGFLLGVLLLQHLASLPHVGLAWLLLICAPMVVLYKPARLPLAMACGFLWALHQADEAMDPALPRALESKDIDVSGVIASLPENHGYYTRFEFDIERAHSRNAVHHRLPELVRLNWYGNAPDLNAGERWRLSVRLKRPWGFMNPGGFDYEGWLFSQGIRATGYVRDSPKARRLPVSPFAFPVLRLRQAIANDIATRLGEGSNTGVITALAIGERGDLDPRHWRLLLATGTNHLLAISGLNIALVAGMVYFLVLRLWRTASRLCLLSPAPRAAAIAGLGAGFGYALLAGFSIPTQRAVIMLAAVMSALILDRATRPGQTLAVALMAVLVWNSAAVLSVGFWLSFAAVAIIVYCMRGRRTRQRWWQGARLQWMLTVGLLPLTLFFFQRASLISPIANLFAVPWMGLVIGPLVLVAVGISPLVSPLATGLLVLADYGLQALWWVLEVLAALPFAQWRHAPPDWALWPAAGGVIWLLAPRGWPARWLGTVLLAPLALAAVQPLPPGAFRLTLLDVGQGLSVVIETREHTLLYDAGSAFSEYFNAGEAVVIPYLRQRGIRQIDTFVISHADNDHAGGAPAVIEGIRARRVLTSAPDEIKIKADRCRAGQRWRWDGVDFEFLYPPPQASGSRNDLSCVLRVANAGGAALLTGDIERETEVEILETQAEKLASEVLVAPHHGSNTSSTPAFLRAVEPELALVSAGYKNRYGFPTPEIRARYRRQGVPLRNTGSNGALSLDVHPVRGLTPPTGYRQANKRYWNTVP